MQTENLAVLEWQLLFSIARFGSCHVAFVTKHTSIDPAHGSRAASALEKKGLIARSEDAGNKRRKLMSLTPLGVETFERIWPKARQVTSHLTDRLNPDDFAEFKRLLDLLNGGVGLAPVTGATQGQHDHTPIEMGEVAAQA
ncbi:MarR family winged helix-turn-helix transcriptional regulator [Tropicibacter sp. Alg240-R139]|uniref:MarR family winged helix-turn-helix transcriptional regulator n=1 Tax=Tropicibacter sp. Alg240-R139 TaxID=2305991 RepID=UPI0013DEE9F1|nr:MarR family winged helix-turn-helix transcriptional regulator [Tropicibacter sp. Alg240-R139]